jgi:hypothetical protein
MAVGERAGGIMPGDRREDAVTKTIESQTVAIPSVAFLAFAVGSMGLSLALMVTGRRNLANFVGQWAPTILIMGLYNKLVKLEPRDDHTPAPRASGAVGPMSGPRQYPAHQGISNRPLAEEQRQQDRVPPRGEAKA